MEHIPVMLKEILAGLEPEPGEIYIDATANGGGHLMALAERVQPDGKVIGIELDPDIFKKLETKVAVSPFHAITVFNDSYANLPRIIEEQKIGPIAGVLFDLGTSSLQLEHSGRGFSFSKDEPLDMRFNPNTTECRASDIVNHATKAELEKIIKEYGEERFARKIAERITDERKRRPILTTGELVRVIAMAIPRIAQHGKIHFATRTFQALRIAVNQEFDVIQAGITAAIESVAPGGRIAVISFHSLEDRIIKNIFRDKAKEHIVSLRTKKPLTPSSEEIRLNPRSRSAKLRIAEKL